ncbi:MAG: iron-containing alcohol dehydrogenase, partial [Planctomycetes bacterium]|nr:iron-containing alcohol dehydrogenase [Planctomycetota bacterium]
APARYARVALALGCKEGKTDMDTANLGIERIKQMNHDCSIPASLSQFGVSMEAVKRMARSALTVTRLLKNNVREITQHDAERIYRGLI